MALSQHEKTRITERIRDKETVQPPSKRLWDSWSKQNDKSEYEQQVREEIATEQAIRENR